MEGEGADTNTNKELVVEKRNSQRTVESQPGRLVMKIQSVTLSRAVSLAMNLLEGCQRHKQRLIPTEERGLQDTATLKITTPLCFLCTLRHD